MHRPALVMSRTGVGGLIKRLGSVDSIDPLWVVPLGEEGPMRCRKWTCFDLRDASPLSLHLTQGPVSVAWVRDCGFVTGELGSQPLALYNCQ